MTDEEKMQWMFKQVHGELVNCRLVIETDEESYSEFDMVAKVMKGDNLCWSRTLPELMFEYLTRHLDKKP